MSQTLISTPLDVDNIATEDDTPVDNLFSEKQQRLLTETLYSSWNETGSESQRTVARRMFLAASNVGLFPSVHQPPLVPDMFLSLDVEVADDWYEKSHRSYFFWEFGKAPEVVIEIVSNRKGHELGSKLHDYARIGVAYYVVHDLTTQLSDEVVRVYELYVGKYQRRADTILPGVALGLRLWEGAYEGKQALWLRWCDESGALIPTGAERARHETERARHEAERAQREMERAERLAAKLRELGIDPDQV
ncbi:MAG: Uma2 family endonuclease [Pyrinomonadaceae bacterium]